MKKVVIFGSSGSIGVNTLDVVRQHPGEFKVTGLSVHSNIALLEEQVKEFSPEFVVVSNELKAAELKSRIGNICQVLTGAESLCKAADSADYDVFVGAMVGYAGLAPTVSAIKRSKRIALANKETLVVGGELITGLCSEYNADLIPIDSEHSAIFQCLEGENLNSVEKLLITASGGPFLNKSINELENVTVEQALNHPNWKMGNKITIDSATMMNKGLEVIEARWLFGLSLDKIEVVVHPQSIIHSMVQFIDGSIKAQLGLPDMRLPIQYALSFPERIANNYCRTSLPKIGSLTFFEPDFEKFKCLGLAFDVMKTGGTAPCILNAANEVAVDKFLRGYIKFNRIPELIFEALNNIEIIFNPGLDELINCDYLTRQFVKELN